MSRQVWDASCQQWVPGPPEAPQRRDGNASDNLDRFDHTAAVHEAQRVRSAQVSGLFRDHQPGGPVGAMSGSQQAPQRFPGITDRLAQAKRNASLQRSGSDAQAEAVSVVGELEAMMNGGFPTLDLVHPIDRRTVAYDQDDYYAFDAAGYRAEE